MTVAGEEHVEAFTICVWVKTYDVGPFGLLHYSDENLDNLISLSVDYGSENLILTLLDEQR